MGGRKYISICIGFSILLLLSSVILLCSVFYKSRHSSVLSETKFLNPHAKVLLVTSVESSFRSTLEEKGIRSVFTKKNINVDVEHCVKDSFTEHFADSYFLGRLRYLESKNKYDVVIVCGSDATELVRKRFHRIWSENIPVFYFDCGSNKTSVQLSHKSNVYSFMEDIFLNDTVAAAIKLFPEAKNFYALYDKTDRGYENWKAFESAVKEYSHIEYNGLNTSFYTREEYIEKLEELPENSVLFFLGTSVDCNNNYYTTDEQVKFLLQNTKHPVFSHNSDGLGSGFIGGSFLNYELAGEQVAEVVVQLLDGEDLNRIPFTALGKGTFCYDYMVAKEKNLDINRFPEDSIIINMKDGMISRTGGITIGIIGLISSLVFMVLIFFIIALREKRSTKKLYSSYEKMEYMVGHDFLTKLPNRLLARESFERITFEKNSFSVIVFDIDDFKSINDNHSHACGDTVLKTISTRLINLMSDENFFVSRFGGDEFFVLYSGGILQENGNDALKLKKVFSEPVIFDEKKIQVNASFGVVNSGEDNLTLDEMLANADLALYEAKRLGKNKMVFFCEKMKEILNNTNYIKKLLEDAIENDGINVVYQPQIDAETGKIHGYEALMRLKNAKISPAEFIPVAEESGLIIKIDRIVTEKVILQLDEWRRHGIPLYRVSINYSYGQISDTEYVEFISELLEKYDISPSLIGIEITESLLVSDKEQILELLKSFQEKGISLALDDFGTGYSSLSYLTFLPVNIVKIDKSLVDNYLDGEKDRFIKNIVRLVHSLEMKLTVEGVEYEWQKEKLKNFRCDYIQGYYYSKPISGNEIEKWTVQRSA